MKVQLVLIVCCAATIFAAPAKNENVDEVKSKRKISVEVKPMDVQLKFTPVKMPAKTNEKKLIVATSTTTEPTTVESLEADTTDSTTNKANEFVNIARAVRPVASHRKTHEKPIKDVGKLSKKGAASVSTATRSGSKKLHRKAEESIVSKSSRRLQRGRSRFRSANIETTVKPYENEYFVKDKLEQKEEPTTMKSDEIKPENTAVEEKKIEEKHPEKLDTEMQKIEMEEKQEEKTTEHAEEIEERLAMTEKPKPFELSPLKKSQQKVASAKIDLPKVLKHDNRFALKTVKSSRPNETEVDKKKSSSPTPEERRNGRKYHDIQIVQLESEIEEDGKYRYNYEGEDGTLVEQQGELKRMGDTDDMGESVKGSYSYQDDEGKTYSVSYTADENGYRPIGDHIPTIPPVIARALAWAKTAKPWVDPWMVEQERLRANRDARKLLKYDPKKNSKLKPLQRNGDKNESIGIIHVESH